ncbi:MAG: hypothetical protein ACYDA6_03230 [Solirubrobacteraceae bacterium]
MRARLLMSTLVIAICATSVAQARGHGKLHIRAGTYAPRASETTKEGYSNGGVDLIVAKGGKRITLAGLACYTGSTPSGGLPANDEVTIRAPHALAISRAGSFSFSGPVTLTPSDTQTERSFTTTFTISGHFQNGKIAVVGTDSSPVCEPGTITHMRLLFD